MSEIKLKKAEEYRYRNSHAFYWFCHDVLEFPDIAEDPHMAFCDYLEQSFFEPGATKDMYLVPRGFFKTTIGVIGFPIWLLFMDANLTIMIASSTLALAAERLLSIEWNIAEKSKLQFLGLNKGMPWSSRSMRIDRRSNLSLKEDSITIGSVDSTNVGEHYLIRIFDDIVDDKNYSTDKGRTEVRRAWRMWQPLNIPGKTKDFVFGTHYPGINLYDDIIENQHEFRTVIRGWDEKFRRENPEVPDNSGILFPSRLTADYIDEQRRVLTLAEFSCFYESKKEGYSGRRLERSWLREIDGEYEVECQGIGKVTWFDRSLGRELQELVRPRLTVDPSLGKKDTDALGLALVGWARDGFRFLIQSWSVTGGIKYATEKIAEIVKEYGVFDIGVEINGWGQMLKNVFEKEIYMQKLPFITVREIVSKGDKIERITSQIQPIAKNGELYVLKGRNKQFIQEYEQFPDSPQLNVIDAVGMAVRSSPSKLNGMVPVRHPTEADVFKEKRPVESFWSQRPEDRTAWVREQMARGRGVNYQFPAMPGVTRKEIIL